MLELFKNLHLAHEPIERFVGDRTGEHHLDGKTIRSSRSRREIHRRGRTIAELALDGAAAREMELDRVEEVDSSHHVMLCASSNGHGRSSLGKIQNRVQADLGVSIKTD
jgi:hypothetical protein